MYDFPLYPDRKDWLAVYDRLNMAAQPHVMLLWLCTAATEFTTLREDQSEEALAWFVQDRVSHWEGVSWNR